MSESKAWQAKRIKELEAEIAHTEWHLVFLLQTLINLEQEHHPEISLDFAGHAFPERIWRQVIV